MISAVDLYDELSYVSSMTMVTVRLSKAEERALKDIERATGWSRSAAVRKSLADLAERMKVSRPSLYEAVKALDLGPGGYAMAPSTKVREAVGDAIRARHRRASAGR